MLTASVQLPIDDKDALTGLAAELGETPPDQSAVVHPFDGMMVAQIVVPLTAAAVAVLKKWLDARIEARKAYKIFIDGLEFTGYSAPEVERLMQALAKTHPRELTETDNTKDSE